MIRKSFAGPQACRVIRVASINISSGASDCNVAWLQPQTSCDGRPCSLNDTIWNLYFCHSDPSPQSDAKGLLAYNSFKQQLDTQLNVHYVITTCGTDSAQDQDSKQNLQARAASRVKALPEHLHPLYGGRTDRC